MFPAPPHYTALQRNVAAQLLQAGLSPALIAARLQHISDTNSLFWDAADRKMIWKWKKQFKAAGTAPDPGNYKAVFVYGTLKTGHHNNRLLTQHWAQRLDVAITAREYILLDGPGFPYLCDVQTFSEHDKRGIKSAAHVEGEVWLVGDECLKRLDVLEGVPDHYRRDTVPVLLAGSHPGTIMSAALYNMQPGMLNSNFNSRFKPYPLITCEPGGHLSWPTKEEVDRRERRKSA